MHRSLFCLLSLLLLTAALAQDPPKEGTQANPAQVAAEFTLDWEPNPPEENVQNYKLYEWTSESPQPLVPGGLTSLSHVLTGVSTGLHIYSLTASNKVLESDHSEKLFVLVVGKPSPPGNLRLQPKALAQLDNKLRVTREHFRLFRQGAAPNYPHRILQSRELLGFAMVRPAATYD